MTESSRLPRGSLTAETILSVAFDVVDELGADGLTVPSVAARLGVRPTAVYWHFRRKEDLLQALDVRALELFNELFPAAQAGAWQDQVRRYWNDYRRILRERPVLCELIVVRWAKSVASSDAVDLHYRRIDDQLAVLMAAGFDPEHASRAYHLLSTFTRGGLLNERSASTSAGVSLDDLATRAHVGRRSDLPSLAAAAPYWNASFATDEDFTAGLNTILAGLSVELAASQPQ